MATAEDWLAWEAIRHQVALAQYSNGVVYRIIKLLNASDARLLSELEIALQGAGSLERIERLESLLYAVRATNAAAFEQVGRELAQELQALVQYEAAYQAQVLTAASPVGTHIATVNVHQVYAAAYAQPFRITKDGAAPVAQLLKGVSEDRIKLIRQAISLGMVEGEPIAKIVQRIRGTRATNYADGLMDNTRRHVETLVRTSVNHMANVAQQSSLEANEDIMAGWVFTATLDGRTTLTCFPGETRVLPAGEILAVSRRRYSGEMLIIRTSGGNEIVCTPNHPILTSEGWLPAHEVDPGKHVLYSVCLERIGVLAGDGVGVPPTLAEIFDAFKQRPGVQASRVSSSAIQFHGDGMSGDSEVDVLFFDSNLGAEVDSSAGEHFGQDKFSPCQDAPLLFGSGLLGELFSSGHPISKSSQGNAGPAKNAIQPGFRAMTWNSLEDVRRTHPAGMQTDGQSLIFKNMHVALSALQSWGDAESLEEACYRSNGGLVNFGDLSRGSPFPVEPQNIVSVRAEFRSTFVYNLHCDLEWYIADSIIVHNCASLNGKRFPVGKGPIPPRHFNCRSYAKPVLKTYREMGIDLPEVVVKGHTRASKDGQVAADLTFSDWLRGQPQDVQKQILGATRAKLFRANQIDVDRFTNNKGVVLSLDQLRKKDAAIFKRAGL